MSESEKKRLDSRRGRERGDRKRERRAEGRGGGGGNGKTVRKKTGRGYLENKRATEQTLFKMEKISIKTVQRNNKMSNKSLGLEYLC